MRDPAPTDLDEVLSPAWLSEALSRPGAPVKVAGSRIVQRLQNSATKIRFEVDFDIPPPDGVRSYCVKGFFGDTYNLGGPNSPTEARYYLEIQAGSAVRTPDCPYAGINETTQHGIILMHDMVAKGGRFLTALEPYSADQAASSLDQLARLHAEDWGGQRLGRFGWLGNRFEIMGDKPWLPLDILQGLMDGPRRAPLDPAICSAERIHGAFVALGPVAHRQPQCLVHGDAHAGNVWEMDGQAGLIDWQLLQRGSWAIDVAYHIGSSLTPEARRASEQPLLKHYLERLRAHGAEPPAWDDAWFAYRTHIAYGYLLWAITRRVDPPIILEFVKRLGLAVSELETFELLGV